MNRLQSRPFTSDDIPAAADLLAARHRRHRRAWPALDERYQSVDATRALIAELFARDGASGAIVHVGAEPQAFVLGAPRDASWGANVWVEDCGSATETPDAVRLAYSTAVAKWAGEGRTGHYVVVPATDEPIVDAWFRLSFGLQHIHGVQEAPGTDFQPAPGADLTIRLAEQRDIAALVEMDPVLPAHSGQSPIFSPRPSPTAAESRQEVEQDLTDSRFTALVVEHDGRVIGTATACSLEVSNGNTSMMRPRRCGFLGYAVVSPDARGLGAGRALSDAVLAWSRDQGYEWVATDWRSTNVEADRTWRSAGYRPTFFRLHRSIA